MNFLLDQNLSPRLVDLLTSANHTAQHVRELHLSRASDQEVLASTRQAGAVLLSADTDFGELLAHTTRSDASPSTKLAGCSTATARR